MNSMANEQERPDHDLIRSLLQAFRYLTRDDLSLLGERATRSRYRAGETIIREGSEPKAIYVVFEGIVRVEQSFRGSMIPIAQLGAGEVFGELSFLDYDSASASVVAEDDVVIDRIERAYVSSLLASVPGFSTRFYQSIAVVLAQRLRQSSAPSMMWG